MYRERECLWQVDYADYRRKDIRMKAYQEIVNYLKRNGISDAAYMLVRDKIQNMRRSVRKERSKIERSNGSYKTSLWYYDNLNFVVDQNEQSTSNVTSKKSLQLEVRKDDDNNDDSDHSSNLFDPLSDHSRVEQPPVKVEYTAKKTVDEENTEQSIPNKDYAVNVWKPDEFEALGINITAKVRRMDTKQKIHAELLIQKVLAKGLLGQLLT